MTSQNNHAEETNDQTYRSDAFQCADGDFLGALSNKEMEAAFGNGEESVQQKPEPKSEVKKCKSRIKVIFLAFLFFVVLACITAVALFANYVHEQYMQVHPLAVDSRPCELEIKVGKSDDIIKVTGARQYSYNYKEVLGHRIIMVDSIREETHLSMNGTKMLVIGNDEKEGWWSLPIGQGEVFNLPLPPADHYTFVAGDKQSVGVVSYKKFCR